MIELSIIEACIKNNAAAQRELYNRFSGKLFGICIRYSNNKQEAEDMLQEGFIRIFKNISSLENLETFDAWMKKVMINTCLNFIKSSKVSHFHLDIDNQENNIVIKEETIASKLLGKQVMQCLLMMPISYRTIINLHAIEGYTHKEIAKMLDIEESTCRSRYMRGKDLLENLLKEHKLIPTQEKNNWLNFLNT